MSISFAVSQSFNDLIMPETASVKSLAINGFSDTSPPFTISWMCSLFTFLTVFGVFILRVKRKELQPAYKTPFYPVTPILFLLISGWILFFIFKNKTQESLYGLGTVALGFIFYWISEEFNKKKENV